MHGSYTRAKSSNVHQQQELHPEPFFVSLENAMKHRWAAQLLVLALTAFTTTSLAAQGTKPSRDGTSGSTLGQNYPNPFNPETWIPFRIGMSDDGQCVAPGRQYRVSLRMYNVLAQLVAIPVLQGGGVNVSGGQRIQDVFLTCGEYTAYWDGHYLNSEREVASGVYISRLEIDGRPLLRKMIVQK
jgi:hypothetical protein